MSDEEPDVDAAVQSIALAVAFVLQNFGPIRDATLGYKNTLLAEGFSADAADRMAVDFHHTLSLLAQAGLKGST